MFSLCCLLFREVYVFVFGHAQFLCRLKYVWAVKLKSAWRLPGAGLRPQMSPSGPPCSPSLPCLLYQSGKYKTIHWFCQITWKQRHRSHFSLGWENKQEVFCIGQWYDALFFFVLSIRKYIKIQFIHTMAWIHLFYDEHVNF